jgi:pentose-5-phosphate-3-epimerase
MKIVPSILTPNISDLWFQIKRLLPYYYYFQIDIVDDSFGKNLTIRVDDFINSISENKEIIDKCIFDFHLMVENPEISIEKLLKVKDQIKLNTMFIQYKTNEDINLLYDKYRVNLGIVLDPDDSVSEFSKKYDLNSLKSVVILSVYPGAQGQDFQIDSLDKIEQLRMLGYRNKIYLDGAVNEKTIPIILSKNFRPDILTPGSFFSNTKNVQEQVNKINLLLLKS